MVTQAYKGKSSMILTSYCPLSTFRCGSCTCTYSVSPCSWLLRTSGSLALGKFLKRTSHLFCTLCTSSGSCLSLTLPRESLKPGPYQHESTRLCLKAVAPSNTDEQWPSVTSAVTNACCQEGILPSTNKQVTIQTYNNATMITEFLRQKAKNNSHPPMPTRVPSLSLPFPLWLAS